MKKIKLKIFSICISILTLILPLILYNNFKPVKAEKLGKAVFITSGDIMNSYTLALKNKVEEIVNDEGYNFAYKSYNNIYQLEDILDIILLESVDKLIFNSFDEEDVYYKLNEIKEFGLNDITFLINGINTKARAELLYEGFDINTIYMDEEIPQSAIDLMIQKYANVNDSNEIWVLGCDRPEACYDNLIQEMEYLGKQVNLVYGDDNLSYIGIEHTYSKNDYLDFFEDMSIRYPDFENRNIISFNSEASLALYELMSNYGIIQDNISVFIDKNADQDDNDYPINFEGVVYLMDRYFHARINKDYLFPYPPDLIPPPRPVIPIYEPMFFI